MLASYYLILLGSGSVYQDREMNSIFYKYTHKNYIDMQILRCIFGILIIPFLKYILYLNDA